MVLLVIGGLLLVSKVCLPSGLNGQFFCTFVCTSCQCVYVHIHYALLLCEMFEIISLLAKNALHSPSTILMYMHVHESVDWYSVHVQWCM